MGSISLNWKINSTNQKQQRIYRTFEGDVEQPLAIIGAGQTSYTDIVDDNLITGTIAYRVESVGLYRGQEIVETSEVCTFTASVEVEPMIVTTKGTMFNLMSLSPLEVTMGGETQLVESMDMGWAVAYTLALDIPTAESQTLEIKSLNTGPIQMLSFQAGLKDIVSWYGDGHVGATIDTGEGIIVLGEIINLNGIETLPTDLHPDITSLEGWFSMNDTFNQDITEWDTSNVTSMNRTFSQASNFNQDISGWNTANVTDMGNMFEKASTFNQPVSSWDVRAVKSMRSMFANATVFNQPLTGWQTSSLESTSMMFYHAAAFNQPVIHLSVGNVKDFSLMFYYATSFNQPIDNWDMRNAELLTFMFGNAAAFNSTVTNLNLSKVTSIRGLFHMTAFNKPLTGWITGALQDVNSMFFGTYFNHPVAHLDISSLTDMSSMFYGAFEFNQPLSDWNVSHVTNMNSLFYSANAFNQDISGWNTGNVTDMSYTFASAVSFKGNITPWNVSKVTNMTGMFAGTSNLDTINLSQWCVPLIPVIPETFSGFSETPAHYPVWGTCPRGEV